MKANIKTYKTNATIFYGNEWKDINWDGLEFENEKEWREWINEQLEWIQDAENYKEIRQILLIKTLWLPKIAT